MVAPSLFRTNEASKWSSRWSTGTHDEPSQADGRRGNAGGNTTSGAASPLPLIAAV
jgi:hypothetical protein